MRRHTFSPLHALVVIILLLSVLTPAAMSQPAPCPAEYPFDPSVGTCVDPETGKPVDPRTGEPVDPGTTEDPTAVPTADIPQGDLASLTIYHLACDDDFDPNGVRDAGGLGTSNGCLTYGTPPFTYTISANGTAVITSTIEAVERDFGRLDVPGPIPAGSLTIAVTPVTGYTTEFVSCGLSVGDGPTDVIEPAISNGTATFNALPDQDVECWVYNVTRRPPDTSITPGGGTVNMSFLSVSCPAGTVINADLDRICTDGLPGVTYDILSETETLARTATDGNGVLIFENVPDGLLAIVETVPPGYGKPYVLCTHYSPTNGDRQYAPTIEFGTGFMATVAPGDDLNCTWFNFPAAGPDNGPTIMIQTRWCEGYDEGLPAETPLAEAEAACSPFSPLEEFQVSLDGQAVATDKSNEINGQLTFTRLPVSESGSPYGIALLAHPDAQTVAVYCDKGTGDGTYAVVPSPLTGPNRIDQPLAAGETLRCSWFINYPYGLTGTVTSDSPLPDVEPRITLVARLCGPGVDLTQSDIDAACPTPGNGIAFDVAMAGEPYLTTTTDPDGLIVVPLPGGDTTFTITPQAPAGYGLPGYLCVSIQSGGGGGGKVVRLTADTPSHELAWASNSQTTCTYYFPVAGEDGAAGEAPQGVIADPGSSAATGITISSYYCPAGTVATDDLIAACTERASGLEFSLLTETDTVATLTTDAAGDVYFADVTPNDYGISVALPTGYGEPIVMCYHAFTNGLVEEGAQDIVFGNQFRFTIFGDGESLECAWYNVPAQGADTGPNIFIEARTCSPGTSITSSMSVFDAQALCPFFYVDLAFQVLNVDQLIATARTNVSAMSAGQVFFTKLPEPDSGAFAVTAGVREGERTLAVFCDQDFGDGTFQVIPVRVSGDRMDQELGMGAGDTLRCTWFIEMNPLMQGTHAPEAPAANDPGASQDAASDEAGDEALPNLATGQEAAGQDETQEEAATPPEMEGEIGLTVVALRCPAEVAETEVVLAKVCTEPASGLSFEILVDDELIATSVTDADGNLAIPPDSPAGMYLLRHQPDPNALELRTECSSVYPNGSTASGGGIARSEQMGEMYLSYDAASRVSCAFYFVMDAAASSAGDVTATSHSLTLQFWSCPAGVDLAADRAVLGQVCSVDTSERSFMLTLDGMTTGETMSGPSTWQFQSSPAYVDLGTATPGTVWCETGGDGNGAPTPEVVPLSGGALTLNVDQPATSVSCDWFLSPS